MIVEWENEGNKWTMRNNFGKTIELVYFHTQILNRSTFDLFITIQWKPIFSGVIVLFVNRIENYITTKTES